VRKLLTFLLAIISIALRSQPQQSYEYEKIANITSPPSQEAYKLGTFGSLPVGLVTGTPNISVPLTSVSFGKIEIPFSLNYSTSGIRVNELEGYTGLGWQLIGGGVITRTVQDMVDEDGNYHFPEYNVKQQLEANNIQAYHYVNHIQAEAVDSEPDIYNFQFLGRSGSFIFDAQQNIVQLDQSNLRIERKSAPQIGYYYEITDEIGNVYEFKETEISFTSKTSQAAPAPSKVSSWYLSKITEVSSQQEIKFIYDPYSYNYTQTTLQSLKFFASVFFQPFGQGAYSQNPLANLSTEANSNIFLSSKILKEIDVVGHSKMFFTYSQHITRAPLTLDNIIMKGYDDHVIDYINLNYTTTANNRVFLNNVENTIKNQQYLFEYNNPTIFPARLSRSQDLYGYYNGVTTNTTLIPNDYASRYSFYIGEKYNTLAERKPNVLFNKIGLLTKITYPTRGFSEINYEGNDEKQESIFKQIYVASSQSFDLKHLKFDKGYDDIETSSGILWNYTISAQKSLFFQGATKKSTSCLNQEVPEDKLKGTLKIYKEGVIYDQIPVTSNTTVTQKLLPAGNYTFTIENVYFPCTEVLVKIGDQPVAPAHYELIPQKTIITSIGSRISSIIDKDSDGSEKSSKFYKYYELFNLYPLEFKSYTADFFLVNFTAYINTSIIINSNDQNSFQVSSPNYLYRKVEISHGGSSFQKGGETHFFNIYPNSVSSLIHGYEDNDRKMHSYNSWINTKESETIYFDSARDPIKKIKYNYGERSSFNKPYFGIIAHESFARQTGVIEQYDTVGTCSGTNDPIELLGFPQCYNQPAGTQVGSLGALYNVEMLQYEIGSFNKFLQSQVTTDYKNGSSLLTTTEYFYDNPAHYQLTSQKTTFPDLSYQTTDYSYSAEKGNTYLTGKNMVGIPLVTETKKNGKTVSKTETIYPTNASDAVNTTMGYPLPKSVLSYNVLTGTPESEITYDEYDNRGNLRQYTTKDGIPVAIIWGYDKTQPIAKIVGAKHPSQMSWKTGEVPQSLIDVIVSASDDDGNDTVTGNPKEQLLLDALDTFRKDPLMADYQVTTYTYDPLIGVRSITPPNGIRENYIYDTAGRLKEVRDINGRILKENKYNYKQ
jgi:YD repeat-containing protein